MTTVTVELSDSTFQFLAEQATSHGYRSPAEYLAALATEAEAYRESIERELAIGLESEPRELTRHDWDELKRRVLERHEAAHGP